MTRFAELLRTLALAEVEFIVVGGVAAAAHGSPRSTQDVDVVYGRSGQNLQKLLEALERVREIINPVSRSARPGPPSLRPVRVRRFRTWCRKPNLYSSPDIGSSI